MAKIPKAKSVRELAGSTRGKSVLLIYVSDRIALHLLSVS
jgi:hypothetical protein